MPGATIDKTAAGDGSTRRDLAPMGVVADFTPANDGQLQLQAGDLVICLSPPTANGWVHAARVSMKPEMTDGFVPTAYLIEAPAHGIMLADFNGEMEGEATQAREGQRVWALWQSDSGWVPVLLDDGDRGCVPETYVQWREGTAIADHLRRRVKQLKNAKFASAFASR